MNSIRRSVHVGGRLLFDVSTDGLKGLQQRVIAKLVFYRHENEINIQNDWGNLLDYKETSPVRMSDALQSLTRCGTTVKLLDSDRDYCVLFPCVIFALPATFHWKRSNYLA